MAYGTLNAGTITPGSGNTLSINEGVAGTAILDEDAMGSNSATHLATQQSIKAYVDSAASQATTAAQGVGTGDSPSFQSITGANQLTGISYSTSTNAHGNWVTVANNTSYICYINEGGTDNQQELWTAVVDGSGAVSKTELKDQTSRYTLGASTNGVRFSYNTGTVQASVMLVFENANADIT